MKNENLTYTTVMHQARRQLGLSLNEYAVADVIYHLSSNPKSIVPGWCYASKSEIANSVGISERSIYSILNKLIKKDLVRRDENTSHLQTTQLWFDTVMLQRYSLKNGRIAEGMKKIHTPTEDFSVQQRKKAEEIAYNNNSSDKENYIHTTSDKFSLSELSEQAKIVLGKFEDYFKAEIPDRKNNLESAKRLILRNGFHNTVAEIDWVFKRRKVDEFCPRITCPSEFEEKYIKLLEHYNRN